LYLENSYRKHVNTEVWQCINKTLFTKIISMARHWWLTPVILATQEVEIRRLMVQSQPGKIVLKDPVSKIPNAEKG
jgi:hypothetical protein